MRARWMTMSHTAALLAALAGGGCNLLSGLSELRIDEGSPTGGGGTGGTTSPVGGGGTGGSGGATTGGGGSGGTTTNTAHCGDGVQNENETDQDCGGPDCKPCAATLKCAKSTDCETEICSAALCVKATSISAGDAHACAALDSGAVYCWGANDHGQLGNVSAGNEAVAPVLVATPEGVRISEVAAGGRRQPDGTSLAHTCGLTSTGTMLCWGANDRGQLGNDNDDGLDSLTPVPVAVIGDVGSIAAGGKHSCAVKQAGKVYCWGDDAAGELADGGDAMSSSVPLEILGGAVQIAAGARHVCVRIDDGGSITCWGDNQRGQVAGEILETKQVLTPAELTGALAIAAGQDSTCAVIGEKLSCWGDNVDSQLTNQVAATSTQKPTTLDAPPMVTAVALGGDGDDKEGNDPQGGHACALLSAGTVSCWGNNRHGQLGRAPSPKEAVPAEIVGLTDVRKIAAGAEISCAILQSGAVRCWGRNDRGQLGTGVAGKAQSSPVAVSWP